MHIKTIDNSYPKKKIAEIEGIYAENKKAFEINYNKMISSADSAFSKGAYAYAKVGYETALELKPEDSYPREKLTELEDLESQIAAQRASYRTKRSKLIMTPLLSDEID